jgi:hypothetical protein
MVGFVGVFGSDISFTPSRIHARIRAVELLMSIPPKNQNLVYHPPIEQPAAGAKSEPIRLGTSGSAPQTIVVPDAPPELKLEKPIPLPLLMSFLGQGKEVAGATRAASSEIAADLPPLPAVISLPNGLFAFRDKVAVPRVNQSAAGSGESQASPPGLPGAGGSGKDHQAAQAGLPEPVTSEPLPANAVRLDLPRDGNFPAVTLGPSIAEQYPDVASSSRKIVSTVYIKVGLKKNWMLEFWSMEGSAPEPPWAYEIYRPDDLKFPEETTVLMIGGTIDTGGQFENLKLLLPTEYAGKDALLGILSRWRFRPATRGGVPVPVQVLLVIPGQE